MAKKTTLNDLAALLTKQGNELRDLTSIVEKGFAKQGKEIKDLTESVAHVVKHMATKEDAAKFDVKIDRLDISIRGELDAIKEQLKNVSGFGKEIDHALARIAAIEKHLGINKKIAA